MVMLFFGFGFSLQIGCSYGLSASALVAERSVKIRMVFDGVCMALFMLVVMGY